MSLGFENVDKTNPKLVYEKKWKKGRNEYAPYLSAFWHASLVEQKTHFAISMSLSGNDALKLSGAMMV